MSSGTVRYVSPDGQRVAVVDKATGDIWLARLLRGSEAAELATMLPTWRVMPATGAMPSLPSYNGGPRLTVL